MDKPLTLNQLMLVMPLFMANESTTQFLNSYLLGTVSDYLNVSINFWGGARGHCNRVWIFCQHMLSISDLKVYSSQFF